MNFRQNESVFHDKYQELNETSCQQFAQVVEKILKSTFIIRSRNEDYPDYRFIAEHKSLFESFFLLLDEDFVLEPEIAVAYIKPTSGRLRVRLGKFDTLILFILRQVYHQKKGEAGSDNSIIQITVGELIERASQTGVFDARNVAKKTYYWETLTKLRKHKIIDFSTTQLDDGTTINIFPSILALIPSNSIDDLTDKIKLLGKSDDDSEGGDEDEEAE